MAAAPAIAPAFARRRQQSMAQRCSGLETEWTAWVRGHFSLTAYGEGSHESTFNWHFAFDAGGSRYAYSATSSTDGTIYIDAQYKGNDIAIVQQLSHELSHIDTRVNDDPKKVTSQQYVGDYLTSEGYAVLANEAVRQDILKATGGKKDIQVASNPQNASATRPLYDAAYAREVANPADKQNEAISIGNTYGAYEHVPDGRSYRQVFLDNYHKGGGTR